MKAGARFMHPSEELWKLQWIIMLLKLTWLRVTDGAVWVLLSQIQVWSTVPSTSTTVTFVLCVALWLSVFVYQADSLWFHQTGQALIPLDWTLWQISPFKRAAPIFAEDLLPSLIIFFIRVPHWAKDNGNLQLCRVVFVLAEPRMNSTTFKLESLSSFFG